MLTVSFYFYIGTYEMKLRDQLPVLFIVILLLLSGCSNAKEPRELKVGLLAVSSGELFRMGGYLSRGAMLAVDEINNKGGLNVSGKKVQIRVFHADSGNNAEITEMAVKDLIASDGVSAIVGPVISEAAISAAGVCEQKRIPMITPSAGTSKLTPLKYSFRVSYTSKIQSKVLSDFVSTTLKGKTVAILFEADNPYSSEIAHDFCENYEQGEGSVVAFIPYKSGQREFPKEMAQIVKSKAGILFLPSNTKQVQLQAAQARAAGFKGTFLGSDAWDPVDLARNPVFKRSFFTDHWRPGLPFEKSRKFEKDFYKKNSVKPTEIEALSYDAMKSLCAAVEYCNSIKPTKIRKALAQMPAYDGVTGKFSYNNHGDPDKDVLLSEIMPDGSVESRYISLR